MEESGIQAGRTYYEHSCSRWVYVVASIEGEVVTYCERQLFDPNCPPVGPVKAMGLSEFARKMYAEHI